MLSPDAPEGTSPSEDITGNCSATSLLLSIACNEFELADAIYTEAEKIKSALDILKDQTGNKDAFSLKELITANSFAEQKVKSIIKEEMLLQSELENALGIHT